MGKSKFNPQEFARLYYQEQLSLEECEGMMGYSRGGLWHPATKSGFVLRDHSTAQDLAYKRGRKSPPNPEIPIDWERFSALYYIQRKTYAEIGPIFNLTHSTLQERAVQRGYISRPAARRRVA